MGRFASTAAVDARARPPYGEAFLAAVAERLRFSGAERLLDLGTGPGVLALGFAPFVHELVAVDPEPAMAEAARAATAGLRVSVVEARAEDLPADLGSFDAATIGRALHWMALPSLYAMFERRLRNAVVVCGARSVEDGANPWLAAYEDVRRRWSGTADHERADDDTIFAGTRFRRRERLAVRFRRRERLAVRFRHAVPVDLLADRVLSMSSSSPERLGDGVAAMRAELAEALAPFVADGMIGEEVEARAQIFSAH